MLRVENIHKKYGDEEVLKGVSFSVRQGQTKVIIGPSGTGKSTLLRCINGLTKPDKGEIWLDGVRLTDPRIDLDKMRQNIGMVFQNFNLFTHLTALDNVRIGLVKVKKLPKDIATEKAMSVLRKVGLEEKANFYPAQLSGGQQQRVSIARALAMDPKLILFDEPTSALDPELIGEVLDVMRNLAESGMTMLVVSHEMGFVRSVSDEIIFLEKGVVVEEGPPSLLFNNPKNKRTREFLCKINELYGG
ncbi:amino acid ABC transporter ATP-binding protein [Candidatus Aerophobetes bacterium]|nr:amino acid ABC transporter ATP-binding protein [Candidatus Aerophobetes bacterium]